MKRYLNKLRDFQVSLVSDNLYRYQLLSGTPSENELFIGKIGNVVKGLFVYKSNHNQIFCLSHDDFSYDFLNKENGRLNTAFNNLAFPSSETILTIPDESGDL